MFISFPFRIIESAKSGDEVVLRHLLFDEHKKKPLSRTLQQSLSQAIDARSAECVRLLLQAGANPNCIKSTKTTIPIPIFVIKNNLNGILQVLLENGCNVNLKWMNNETILHVAVRLRKEESCRLLVLAGADPSVVNDQNESPFTLAIKADSLDILKQLLEHPKSAESVDFLGRTVLHTAARLGKVQIAHHLMEKGYLPDIPSSQGYTPLMEAVMHNHVDMVRTLTSKCDIDFAGWRGMTGLLLASQGNSDGCLRILLEAGADVNVQDIMGNTALIHAGPFEKVIVMLLDYGIDCNIQNNFGMTALWFAAFYEYTSVVTILLRANSNPELKGLIEDEFHTSPLEIALKRGHYDISRRIIYSGCNNRNLARFMENADIMPVFRSPAGQALKVWVREWLREVKPLRYLARQCIRKSLGRKSVTKKVTELPLPPLLVKYVNLGEVESV